MCPLVPVWALGGGVAAHRLHTGQKDPLGLQKWSLTHIVSPLGPAGGYFTDSGYRGWLCQADELVCSSSDALGHEWCGGREHDTCSFTC